MKHAEKQQYIAVPNFEARHLPTQEDTKRKNLQLLNHTETLKRNVTSMLLHLLVYIN